jgi:hypothetical protein
LIDGEQIRLDIKPPSYHILPGIEIYNAMKHLYDWFQVMIPQARMTQFTVLLFSAEEHY